MGYNTALMICNDGLHELERDPDAGKKIARGVLMADRDPPHSISIGNHCNPVSILPSQHADTAQLVVVGGNWIQSVAFLRNRDFTGASNDPVAERVLRQLADDLGYNLSKKAWRKREDAQRTPTRQGGDGLLGSGSAGKG